MARDSKVAGALGEFGGRLRAVGERAGEEATGVAGHVYALRPGRFRGVEGEKVLLGDRLTPGDGRGFIESEGYGRESVVHGRAERDEEPGAVLTYEGDGEDGPGHAEARLHVAGGGKE